MRSISRRSFLAGAAASVPFLRAQRPFTDLDPKVRESLETFLRLGVDAEASKKRDRLVFRSAILDQLEDPQLPKPKDKDEKKALAESLKERRGLQEFLRKFPKKERTFWVVFPDDEAPPGIVPLYSKSQVLPVQVGAAALLYLMQEVGFTEEAFPEINLLLSAAAVPTKEGERPYADELSDFMRIATIRVPREAKLGSKGHSFNWVPLWTTRTVHLQDSVTFPPKNAK